MRFAMLLLVAGCRSIFGIHDPDVTIDAANQDAVGDGMVTNCRSFSTVIDTCALPAGMPMSGSATNYDSDSGALMVGGSEVAVTHVMVSTIAGPLDVVSITTFVQDADTMLRITGKLPVAFVVSGQIEIAGRIDLSAGGAGAGCDPTSTGAPGAIIGSTGDGGGGGGNTTAGGDGGGGDAHSSSTYGGAAVMPGYHVGCSGGHGGSGSQVVGGLGGGGFYLVVASDLLISGTIDVSGGGGKGAAGVLGGGGGGGGGGAGGALVIEAPHIAVTGHLNAIGGGGGGGGNQTVSGVAGQLGSTGGNGGHGSTNNIGGHGGTGSLAAGNGAAGTTFEGGGGGGGAGGRIGILSPDFTNLGVVAPPPS